MGVVVAALGAPAVPKKAPDPKLTSIFPVSVQRGTQIEAEIRGSALTGARDLMLEGTGIAGRVVRIDPLPAGEGTAAKEDKQTVHVELKVDADATLGWHEFRL